MYRTLKTPFEATKQDINRLFECNRISAEVWNACLVESKEYSLANEGKWMDKTQIQKATKGKQLSIQAKFIRLQLRAKAEAHL